MLPLKMEKHNRTVGLIGNIRYGNHDGMMETVESEGFEPSSCSLSLIANYKLHAHCSRMESLARGHAPIHLDLKP